MNRQLLIEKIVTLKQSEATHMERPWRPRSVARQPLPPLPFSVKCPSTRPRRKPLDAFLTLKLR